MSEKKLSALELDRVPRIWLGALGLLAILATGAIILFRDGTLPDLLLAALAICGVVSLALCILGLLPSGFQVAGMQVNFTVDKLSDLLGTIGSLEDVDPDARKRVVELIESAAEPAVFAAANERYGNGAPSANTPTTTISSAETSTTESVESKVVAALRAIAVGPILERQEVERSGKGKNPKFDYQFEFDLGPEPLVVVCQLERYWNPSSVDLLKRKLLRALQKSTSVSRAVIVVPRGGLGTVRDAVADIPGVTVLPEEQFDKTDDARRTLVQKLI